MSESKRKNFSGDFKAKVALEALRSIKTVKLFKSLGCRPTQVGLWKKELQEQHPGCLMPGAARNPLTLDKS